MSQKLSALPVGALVKDTSTTYNGQPIIWKIADQNHEGYPANSTTLITDKIINKMAADGKEAENADEGRKTNGNNRYRTSNIRQWLNSEGDAGNWWTAQNLDDDPTSTNNHDAPPSSDNLYYPDNGYDSVAGFLTNFSYGFKSSLLETTLNVGRNTVTDGSGSETIVDKIFLASAYEVGMINQEYSAAEGSKLAIFSDNESLKAYYTGSSTSLNWWLRSACLSDSFRFCVVRDDGYMTFISANASRACGIRPLCNLSSETLVSDTADTDGVYTIVPNEYPTDSDNKLIDLSGLKRFNQNHNSDITAHPAILTEIDTLRTMVENNGSSGTGATKVKLLGDCEIGDIVYINENNIGREYIVIQKGNPDPSIYDASCDGVWLIKERTYSEEPMKWSSLSGDYSDVYYRSTVYRWLNSDFLGTIDAKIRSLIKTVKIPFINYDSVSKQYEPRYGGQGVPGKVFSLACIEMGLNEATTQFTRSMGKTLSYFSNNENDQYRERRLYKLGDCYKHDESSELFTTHEATNWWLRSIAGPSTKHVFYINKNAYSDGFNPSNTAIVRPVFILPPTLYVDSYGYVTP